MDLGIGQLLENFVWLIITGYAENAMNVRNRLAKRMQRNTAMELLECDRIKQ
ncbi:hypothetical protein WMO41_01305 [Ventrimonas sp. CLA-AP-H27]|uniref:Uncharacterized protein n=1 Tax=Ventrimonas faecis TaxID=3133170 RepID=A0ABV1HHN3_9FIRM